MKKLHTYTLLVLFLSIYTTQAQDGLLDLTFGVDGIVQTDANQSNDVANDLLIQPDGKIIAAGYTSDGVKDYFCLIRYKADGVLDTGFGVDGIVITEFVSTSVGASVVLQADNKIVLAGHSWGGMANEFALARYLPDGSIDESFGEAGLITTLFSNKNAIGRSIVLQADGKIILGGHVYTFDSDADDFALARYLPDGILDTTFGNEGQIVTSIGDFSMDWLNDLKLQTDGKILAAGFSNDQFALVRYSTDGSLDTSFGNGGVVTTSFTGTEHGILFSIQVLDDGKILGAGFIRDSFSNFALARYEENGDLDSTFGIAGIVNTAVSEFSDAINTVQILEDGQILAAGAAFVDGQNQFALARYNVNGELDVNFGTDGIINDPIDPENSQITAAAIQADGKIVACGFSRAFPYDFILTRYTNRAVSTENLTHFPGEISIYPNPTRDFVMIDYQLEEINDITIRLLNSEGRLIETCTNNKQFQGIERIELKNLPPNTYFVTLEIKGKAFLYEVAKL